MVARLGTNINSLRVQTQLARSTEQSNRISERLSSGSRVNRPSDDAAGLAISASLRAQTRIQGQSIRNLNDGISAVSIAEGAIDQLCTILSRIEELAIQSMNGTFGSSQRTVMQQEVTPLQAEWNRIVESTTYNGRQLLAGTSSQMLLQGGRGDGSAVNLQVGKEALAGGFGDAAGATTRVSTSSAEVEGNNTSTVDAISADGRYVAFYSTASNLVAGDTNGANDTFIKDTVTGETTRVSTSSAGGEGNGASRFAFISADGRYVAFSSTASNLVAGDTNGVEDSFIKDTVTGITTRVTTGSAGEQGNGSSRNAFISADGRYVAFDSAASNLVAGDINFQRDAFIKDTVTGATSLISTSSAGEQAYLGALVSSISADGRYVGLRSISDNLVPGDTNVQTDSFIKDTQTGVMTRVSTSSAGGEGNGSSRSVFISADGRYVAFSGSASNLVSGDSNSSDDVFLRDLSKMGIQTLSGMVVSNQASAVVTASLIQSYRNELITHRANLGATSSRIDAYLSALSDAKLSVSEASSRMTDADIATEGAQLAATRIRQQVGASLLAQANLEPQLVLELLRAIK